MFTVASKGIYTPIIVQCHLCLDSINSIGFFYYRSPDICYISYLFSIYLLQHAFPYSLYELLLPPDLEVRVPVTSLTMNTTSLLLF